MEVYILVAVIVMAVISEVGFLISLALKNSTVADICWGLYFIFIAGVLLIKTNHSDSQYLVTLLVGVWGLRYLFHIVPRTIKSSEDWRYKELRKKWGEHFDIRSYLQNFLLQGVIAIIIAAPILIAAHAPSEHTGLKIWQYFGLIIWLKGFFTESIADYQLKNFIKKRSSKNEIMQNGLWRYSRHPNYYGEMLQWLGLWVIVVGLPYGIWAFLSPLLITFLLVRVSGIPLLEKKYKGNKDYQRYAKRTSPLIPWFPKKA